MEIIMMLNFHKTRGDYKDYGYLGENTTKSSMFKPVL